MEELSNQLLEESERSRLVLLSLLEDQKNAEDALRLRHETTKRFQKVISELVISPFLVQGEVTAFSNLLNEKVAKALNVARVSVWLFNGAQSVLQCVDLYDSRTDAHSEGTILKEEEFHNEFAALKTAKFVNADNPLIDPRTAGFVEGYLKPNRITSMLDLVIRQGDKNLGTLCFEHVDTPHHWEAEEIAFGSQLADQLSITLYNRDRLKILQTLEQNEAKFRTVADFTYDWEYWEKETGEIVYMSPSCERITGFSREEFISNPSLITKIVVEEDIDKIIEHHKRDYTEEYRNHVDELEFRIAKKDGSIVYLHHICRPILDNENNFLGRRISNRDITDRTRTQLILNETNQQLVALIEAIPDAIFFKDGVGRWLITNEPAKKLFLLHNHDWIGKTDLQLGEERPELKEAHDNCIIDDENAWNKKALFIADEFVPDEQGKIHHYEVRKVPLFEADGSRKALVIIGSDITERKQAEEALKESETTFRKLFEESADPNLLLNETGFFECNQATLSLLGYNSKEEFLNKQPWEVSPNLQPDGMLSSEKAKLMIDKAIRNGYNRFEWIHLKADGTEIPVEVMLTSITIKGKQTFYTVWRDITDRKLAEASLQESELKYRELVENSPDAIAIYVEGKITFVNNECVRLMAAKSPDELLGKSVIQFVHPDFRQFVADRMKEVVTNGIVLPPAEEKFIKLDGSDVDVEVKAMAIKFGRNPAVQLIIRDITERKRMTGELIASKEAAERANSVKDGFIANMSHEIRTPLNGILGMTSIIKESLSQYVTEEEEPLFEGIQTSSQRIIRTVDMILNFSRLKSGDFPIAPQEISLTSICTSLHKEFFIRAKSASLELTFENNCDEEIFLMADEYSITHTISNLLDNAIKYTKEGSINLMLTPGKEGEILVKVKDSGIGMKDEYLKHLFEPYQQEEMGYGRAYEGVGLGLSLVKQFMDLNNGQISVESKKEFGTTFTLTFTKKLKAQAKKEIKKKDHFKIEGQTSSEKPLVLVVEDDLINQVTITNFLASKYKTIVISSSDEALKVLENNDVHFILMDISIRGSKNGLELTKELKEIESFRHIPIIAITAHAFDKDRQNSLAAGCNEYLSKPFTKEELLSTLAKF